MKETLWLFHYVNQGQRVARKVGGLSLGGRGGIGEGNVEEEIHVSCGLPVTHFVFVASSISIAPNKAFEDLLHLMTANAGYKSRSLMAQ